MKINDYQNIISETAVYPKEFSFGYCTLGLVGEFNEFCVALEGTDRKAKLKEAGDVCWYLTALCKEHELPVSKMITLESITWEIHYNPFPDARNAIGELAEWTKKYYRDGNFPVLPIEIYMTLKSFGFALMVILAKNGLNLEEILKVNYEKLIKRRETNTLHGSGDDREDSAG